MANFSGFERYLTLCQESVFNTYPGSPTNVYVPMTDFSVAIQNTFVQSELYTGLYDGTHNQANLANITGSLSCPLWTHTVATKPLAQWLIDWALNRPSGSYLNSFSAVAAEVSAGTTRKFTGLTVNNMKIGGTNGQLCTIALDLIGAGETGITTGIPAIPETGSSSNPFAVNFSGYGGTPGVEMYINSSQASTVATTADAIRSFNLVVNNNAASYFTNSYFPTTIGVGKRAVNFNFQVFKDSNVWDLLRRSSSVNEFHIELKLRGFNGSGTGYNVINLEFERVSFAGATDTYSMNAFTEQGIVMMALKPSYTNHLAIQQTYTTEP